MTTGVLMPLVFKITYRPPQTTQAAPTARVDACKPKKITKQKRKPRLGTITSRNIFLFPVNSAEKPK
jgi:hypothetical protein